MYSTTGLTRDQIVDLCAIIRHSRLSIRRPWPPKLGLFDSVRVAFDLSAPQPGPSGTREMFGVSQSTISRAITAVTPLLAEVLSECVPTSGDLDARSTYIVDGTLVPCWSWRVREKELYSGKHRTTGMNLQVACTLSGRLAWVSDPVPGSRHDSYCLRTSGILDEYDVTAWMGDKGYIGTAMLTPIRKPKHRDLLDWEKDFNYHHNKKRAIVEHVIANLTTWRILHTDYRRPIDTFATTISAVLGLQFYRQA